MIVRVAPVVFCEFVVVELAFFVLDDSSPPPPNPGMGGGGGGGGRGRETGGGLHGAE